MTENCYTHTYIYKYLFIYLLIDLFTSICLYTVYIYMHDPKQEGDRAKSSLPPSKPSHEAMGTGSSISQMSVQSLQVVGTKFGPTPVVSTTNIIWWV
jgi:hypothetical protein